MNMITVRHMYRTFNKHTFRTMPENPFQNFFFFTFSLGRVLL